jgi:hypothetical protein
VREFHPIKHYARLGQERWVAISGKCQKIFFWQNSPSGYNFDVYNQQIGVNFTLYLI